LESANNNDNGFCPPNPCIHYPWVTAPFTDFGPYDHGANFDFKFNPLLCGESFSFNIYYGAGANKDEAVNAIVSIAAEMYSFGKPNVN
jgi:hypothetical protein